MVLPLKPRPFNIGFDQARKPILKAVADMTAAEAQAAAALANAANLGAARAYCRSSRSLGSIRFARCAVAWRSSKTAPMRSPWRH